jgi:hypothetical protein
MGATGQSLATFRFNETSNVEDVKITDLYILDQVASTTAVKPTFNNLSLYSATGTFLGTQTGSASTSVSAGGYYYKFTFGSPVVVPKLGSVSVLLKGDVATFDSSGASDNATHVFKIATSSDALTDSTAEVVVALGRTSNNTSTVTAWTTVPSGQTMTTLRNKVTVTATPVTTTGRARQAGENIGTLTFAADPLGQGDVVVNTIVLKLSGSAVSSTTPAAFALQDTDGSAAWDGATIATTTATSVTFSITNGILSSSGRTIKVVLDSTATSNGASVTDALSVQLIATTDVQYTTAISGGTAGVGLSSTGLPLLVSGGSYE